MIPKLSQSCPIVVFKLTPSYLKVSSKLSESCLKVISKLSQSYINVVVHCYHVVPKWCQGIPIYVTTWPRDLLIECLNFAAVQRLDWNPVRLELFRKEDDILLIGRQHIFGIKSKKIVRKLPEKQNCNYIDKVIYISKDYGFANVIEIYINSYPSYKSSWLSSSQPIPSCHGGSNQIHGTAR